MGDRLEGLILRLDTHQDLSITGHEPPTSVYYDTHICAFRY